MRSWGGIAYLCSDILYSNNSYFGFGSLGRNLACLALWFLGSVLYMSVNDHAMTLGAKNKGTRHRRRWSGC